MRPPSPLKRVLKTVLLRLYYYTTGIPVPFPRRLPWGDWWLSWDDRLSQQVRTNSFEGAETTLLQRMLKPGMVMIDAGAHRGYFTLLASSILGERGKVISFEPSPRERQWIWMHKKINGRKNIQIEKYALGSKGETAEFFISLDRQTGCNSLRYIRRGCATASP
jgi:hypothetical protein